MLSGKFFSMMNFSQNLNMVYWSSAMMGLLDEYTQEYLHTQLIILKSRLIIVIGYVFWFL